MTDAYSKYWAITQWDGRQWLVRVEDYDEVHRDDTTAGRLAQVGPNASFLLGAQFGCDRSLVHASVEVRLPEQVEYALRVAEAHVADAAREVESVVVALRQANISGHDIAALLAARTLHAAPQRPLLVPNTEIAACGLNRRPDVIAVEWADADVVLTCCRGCVEKNVRPWQERDPTVRQRPSTTDLCAVTSAVETLLLWRWEATSDPYARGTTWWRNRGFPGPRSKRHDRSCRPCGHERPR